jgi:GNAT superfamily N-acetyltransferase
MSETRPTIRQADAAAQEVASDLLRRFFAEEGFGAPEARQRAGLAAMLADPHCAVFLAWLPGADRAVGIATASWSPSVEYERAAEMDDLYVVPAERGRGIAAALIDAVTAWCRSQGCRTLLVTVAPDGELSHGLTGFYTRRGFVDEFRTLLALPLEDGA